MKLNNDSVPATVEESVKMVTEALEPRDWEALRNSPPTEFYYSVGIWLRDHWSILEEGTILRNSFTALGVSHPDDVVGYLLAVISCRARGLPFDQAYFVKSVQARLETKIGKPLK